LKIGSAVKIQLHGFLDHACGANLCVCSVAEEGNIITKLLCSELRVAPDKQLLLSRLELCGAMKKLTFVLDLYFSKICLWTDSTVLLVWIGAPLTEWKIVLANSFRGPRYDISIIWYHISSHNSADVFSRGTLHRHPQ
jgi:hypothetical protein